MSLTITKKLWLHKKEVRCRQFEFPRFWSIQATFDEFRYFLRRWYGLDVSLVWIYPFPKTFGKSGGIKSWLFPLFYPHASDRNGFLRCFSDSVSYFFFFSFLIYFYFFKKSQTWLFVVSHFTKLEFLKKMKQEFANINKKKISLFIVVFKEILFSSQ